MVHKQELGQQDHSFVSTARMMPLKCQAKIVETPVLTILFIADFHTAADHVVASDTRIKYLKHSQKHMIASAVPVAPLQSTGERIRNVQISLTKVIEPTIRKSFEHLVRKEQRQIDSALLEVIVVDSTLVQTI